MATVEKSGSAVSAASAASSANQESPWIQAKPKTVDHADSMSAEARDRCWNMIYAACGMGSANEVERRAVRAAVYTYGCKNGTSRAGDYAGVIVLANGKKIEASIIPTTVGKMKIRKFFRSCMNESYTYFKESRVMEEDPRFIAKQSKFSIPAEAAFAVADWLDDCPYFTPAEARAHAVSFNRSIERSRRARGGKGLDEVEGELVDEALRVNGPMEAANGSNGTFEF